MNETIDGSDTVVASSQSGSPLDIDVLPVLTSAAADRSMLVVQYALAAIAAACAILLSRAS